MQVSIFNNIVNFRTPFSGNFDLIQKYRGACEGSLPYNNTVDIVETGLMQKDKWDFWHIDIPFSISNDEAPAPTVNNVPIGCNHGQPGGISLYLPGHDKTIADIGSLWKDEDGTIFVLLYTDDASVAFVSENINPSETDYAFKNQITGTLVHVADAVHTASVTPGDKRGVKWIEPVNRYTKRQIIAYTDGKAEIVSGGAECDYAEIHEEYDIVNPASMVRALHENRPRGGYTSIPQAMGDTMIRCRYIYRIEGDGTTVIDFSYEKVQDVRFQVAMGAMFQEKLDAYGGGIYRCIPKTLPLDTPEGTFDFSVPLSIAPGPFPREKFITAKYWENPVSPPDRIVDIFRDTGGHDRMGFACGYLPVYDGFPEKRISHLDRAVQVIRTRKAYPYFMSGDLPSLHGIAYKKYFLPAKDNAFVYTVPAEGKTYIYMHFFAENTLEIPVNGKPMLLESSDTITYKTENGILQADGTRGYAVFVCK
ncbi:MAG: hypothetical protein IJN25_07155 [Clostridia bacterium]|nr:hypothetical protein [Oscillospiraceae bacterium]MBQ7033417.1 hypothetical protein [Clostridia bacterium]